MASTLVTLTTTTPFLSVNKTKGSSLSQLKFEVPKRDSLRINAISKKWEPTKVVPQADRALIRLGDLPEKSSGGVLLPKSAVKFERYLMGEVLSVGAEAGEVEAGKRVLFSDINAYEENSITIQRNLHPTCELNDAYDVHSMPSFRRDHDRLIWEQMLSIAFAKLVICWPWWSDIAVFLLTSIRPTPYNEGQLGSSVRVKLNEIFRLYVLQYAQHQGIGYCCFLCSVLLNLPLLMFYKREFFFPGSQKYSALMTGIDTTPSCSDRQFLI